MKQINVRVDDQIAGAFYRFCQRLDMEPASLVRSFISIYGRFELLMQRVERGEASKDETFIELGRILADVKQLGRANGEFKGVIEDLLKPHGISVSALGL